MVAVRPPGRAPESSVYHRDVHHDRGAPMASRRDSPARVCRARAAWPARGFCSSDNLQRPLARHFGHVPVQSVTTSSVASPSTAMSTMPMKSRLRHPFHSVPPELKGRQTDDAGPARERHRKGEPDIEGIRRNLGSPAQAR